MDAQFFKITVRAIVAIYVICKLWQCMISSRGRGFYRWIFLEMDAETVIPTPVPKSMSHQSETATDQPIKNTESVVGQSQTTYLEKPIPYEPIPIRSEDLKLEESPTPQPDPTAEEVDDNLTRSRDVPNPTVVLSPEERLIPVNVWDDGSDDEFSRGMTFSDLSNVAEVVMGLNVDEGDRQSAAVILSQIRQSDLFDFFSKQLANKSIISNLIDEYIDGDGTLIAPSERKIASLDVVDFDISRYV